MSTWLNSVVLNCEVEKLELRSGGAGIRRELNPNILLAFKSKLLNITRTKVVYVNVNSKWLIPTFFAFNVSQILFCEKYVSSQC